MRARLVSRRTVRPKKFKKDKRNASFPGPRDHRMYYDYRGGMPDSQQTTLEYAEIIEIKNNSAEYSGYTFRGNSLYDPDYTSTGHQPRYFDTLMSIYSKYEVKAARISIQVIAADCGFVTVFPTTDVVNYAIDPTQYLEMPRAKQIAVGNAQINYSRPLVASYTTQGVLGLTSAQRQDNDLYGTDSTSPTSLWYINVAGYSTNGGTAISMFVSVHISYTAVFFDRLNPQLSKIGHQAEPSRPNCPDTLQSYSAVVSGASAPVARQQVPASVGITERAINLAQNKHIKC